VKQPAQIEEARETIKNVPLVIWLAERSGSPEQAHLKCA
jgi:hypothetical protein